MLVAGIDRNKVTEPEKAVDRLVSTKPAYRIAGSEPATGFQKHLQKRKGIILRNGDLRHGDRRTQAPGADAVQPKQQRERKGGQERRQMNNRTQNSRWNSKTHEIVIIAIEKDPAAKSQWNVGEEVIVGPANAMEAGTPQYAPPQAKFQRSDSRPAAQPEDDYIVHLSRSLGKKP